MGRASPTRLAAPRRAHVPESTTSDTAATSVAPARYVYGLSIALAFVAALGGMLTFAFDDELTATPVMNGSARGTALVLFGVAVPVLLLAMAFTARGSVRAVFVWFGTVLYLAYNAVLLLLGTPLNRYFLLYVAALSLSIAVAIGVAATTGPHRLARHCSPRLPVRGLAVYLWVVVALNALAWLGRVVPATVEDDAARLLDGTGITMIPTYFQDLAFWLPLLAVGAVWLWRRLPWGYLIVGGGLVFWAIEGITVATDQWFGHRADPLSTIASDAAVIPFALSSVIGVGVAWLFLRHVHRHVVSEPARAIDLR